MAAKNKATNIRLEERQAVRLDQIATENYNTPAALIRMAVDCLIDTYDTTGALPRVSSRALTDNQAAAAGRAR